MRYFLEFLTDSTTDGQSQPDRDNHRNNPVPQGLPECREAKPSPAACLPTAPTVRSGPRFVRTGKHFSAARPGDLPQTPKNGLDVWCKSGVAPARPEQLPNTVRPEKDTLMLSGFTQLFNNLYLFGGDLLSFHFGF
ncbi:hypothetical protein ABZ319_33385 [Nocardia sp. NPDC005978]|uniref:hypothetical protein n=1 Tax=Nocardia sp. NPDC005978 TaxID=3156725 RepID=UPI0033B34E22